MFTHPIKSYRDKHHLSLEALASKLGITRTSLSKYELGQRGISLPMASRIEKITSGEITVSMLAQAVQKREAANG